MESVKAASQKVASAVNGTLSNGSSSRQTVLITGASGFLAAHVLNEFLDHGYNVRGTVRSEETAAKVRKTHAKYGDKLSFAIVKDVAEPGAFDEAVKGVDGVIHTASPFQMAVTDNEKELLQPAVQGTKGVLKSIKAYNPSVRRVVITSSFASIVDVTKGDRPEHTYTEKDWNPVSYEDAKTADGGTAYCASKTFAEKAAFEFVETEKPSFTISTICPPMVYGPNAHSVSNLAHLNTSSADIWRLMNGTEKDVPPTSFYAFVDARDVARVHRLAYESPKAAGERYFVTGGSYSYQDICDIIRANVPEARKRTPEGKPGNGVGKPVYKVDNSKAKTELGMTFRSLEECIIDTANNLLQLEKTTEKA
ncbi:methylglyoxal reductase (NADPH-dependent) gre2 [Xylographa vitiligo]|nr:methylglyoxal reductase (NADPH-dependent) gre2 [Xylographa vitiligo]